MKAFGHCPWFLGWKGGRREAKTRAISLWRRHLLGFTPRSPVTAIGSTTSGFQGPQAAPAASRGSSCSLQSGSRLDTWLSCCSHILTVWAWACLRASSCWRDEATPCSAISVVLTHSFLLWAASCEHPQHSEVGNEAPSRGFSFMRSLRAPPPLTVLSKAVARLLSSPRGFPDQREDFQKQ